MNLKACTFERLAFIFVGGGGGAQVGKTSLLEVELILRRKRRRWVYSIFSFATLQALGSRPTPSIFGRRRRIFLQCEAKIVRRHTSRQRSGNASQQRLRPRRFDSTVKRVPKLRFEPVSCLFLVCL